MAFAQRIITSNSAGDQEFTFTFDYIKEEHIKVFVNFVEKAQGTGSSEFQVITNTTPKKVRLNTGLSSDNTRVEIRRVSSLSTPLVDFEDGSTLTAADLDTAEKQSLFIVQELDDALKQGISIDTSTGIPTLNSQRLSNVADPVNAQDVVTKNYLERTGSITSTQIADGTIVNGDIANATITGAKLVDNAVTTPKINNSAITTDKIASNAITSSKIGSAAVTNAAIADDAVTTAKIGDDTISTALIQDGAVLTAKIADGQVQAAKLGSNSVTNAKIQDNAVTTAKIGNNTITTALIQDDAVTTAKIGDNTVSTALIQNSAVTTAKLADDAVTNAKVAPSAIGTTELSDNAVTTVKIQDNQITHTKILNGNVTADKLAGSAVTNAKIANNAITTAKIGNDTISTSLIQDNAVTTGKIADSELKTLAGMQSGTASKLADSTALTSDIADLNQLDGMAKQTTITDDDTKFPTSGAVVDFVAAQIAPIGGLEVIANEDSFPTTQPASGVVISISDIEGLVVNGSGVATNARTSGNGSDNVTINGFPSSLQSKTMAAGLGLMVSSTGSSQTYTYHKLLAKEADVEQLSNDINDFAARYRVGSSNPSTDLDAGDLFFNTSTSKLLVYNATNSAWEEAQSIGNFFISTFSESVDGSRQDFTVSNAPANAQQILLSINGVVQKPNSGTSTPSEGFALSGSTVKLAAAPPSGSDIFIVVMGSTVNIGTPSNNTVTSAILQNGSVIEAKIGSGAVTQAKLASNSVGSNQIIPNNVVTSSIAADAIVNSLIADNAIEAANISNGAVTKSKIENLINNNADNRLITGSGTANTLNGEANLTFTGNLLHINSANSGLPRLRLQHSGSGNDVFEITAGLIGVSNGGFGIYDLDETAYRLVIDSNGSVGIGITNPSSFNADGRNLVVGTGSGGQGLSIYSANNNYGNIYFADGTSDGSYNAGGILYNHSSNFMRFDTAAGERFRIDANGKLSTGGESAPDVSPGGLCLNQASEGANIISCKSSDINHGRTSIDETDTWFSLRKVSDNKGGAFIRGYTDQSGGDPGVHIAGYIDSQASSFKAIQLTGARRNVNNTGSAPFSSGNPIVRISNDFDTTVASFTPDGLAFNNDTAAANSLGDYEEGTFVPDFANVSNSDITVNYATYTKVGRLVHFECKFTVSSSDASTFGFTLPFSQAGSRQTVIPAMSNRSGSTKPAFAFTINANQSYAYAHELEGFGTSGTSYNTFSGDSVLLSGTFESN